MSVLSRNSFLGHGCVDPLSMGNPYNNNTEMGPLVRQLCSPPRAQRAVPIGGPNCCGRCWDVTFRITRPANHMDFVVIRSVFAHIIRLAHRLFAIGHYTAFFGNDVA